MEIFSIIEINNATNSDGTKAYMIPLTETDGICRVYNTFNKTIETYVLDYENNLLLRNYREFSITIYPRDDRKLALLMLNNNLCRSELQNLIENCYDLIVDLVTITVEYYVKL